MALDSVQKVNCTYCVDEITGLRVRCVTCDDFDLCLQCFSAGAEIGTHKNDHPYRFMEAGAVDPPPPPILKTKWSPREQLQLIIGIEEFGFDKWSEIAENIKMRTAEEAQEEYYKHFVDGNVGNVTWKRAYEKREQLVDLSKDEPPPPPISPALPPLDITPEEASLLGYLPRRDDFEKEFDNEAEELLTPQLTDSTMNADDDLDVALTLAHCDMYTQKLRERFRRKRICRDYHLVSQYFSNSRKPKLPKRPTGEQEVEEKLRWLCQLQTAQEHDCLVKNIQRQRDLQQRLSELLRYRRNGVTRIEELPHFDQEFRSSKGSSDSSSHASLTSTAKRKSEKNGGSDSFSTTRSSTPPTVSRSSSHRTELEPLQPRPQQQWALSHPLLTEPSKHLLSKTEAQLCESLDLLPSQFISIKTLLLTRKDGRCESLVIHTTSKEKKDGGNSATHSFRFQKVFTESAEQSDLFGVVAAPVVQAVFSGYNGAILAYGQTGTGKTHSISGGTTDSTRGMIPRAFQKIFDMIAEDQANNSPREFAVAMSTLEIYNELCIDLLRKDSTGPEEKFRVELRDDAAGNVRLRNLKEYPVRNMQDVEKYLRQSTANRVTADTPMNQHSSRSHCIFTLYLRQRVAGERKQVKSKLHLIDLSGSERVWKNRISGHLLYEAKHINLSLHYLEQVIIALNDPKRSHVPYRNSSITNFLRDSLGGNSRTAMVFTISLEPNNFFETLSTCRFSQRVSLVKNHTKKVIEYDKDEELDFLRLEVERLKRIISEMIGEDQMKLRLSASEESVPSKPEVHTWIKCSLEGIPPPLEKFTAVELEKQDVQPDSNLLQQAKSEKKCVSEDSKGKHSKSGSSSSGGSSNEESDDGTKPSKKSIQTKISSTYLDEVYNLLSNEDPMKSDLLNISKLLSAIGLELPYADRNTGKRFAEQDQVDFKRYLELPQNREVLKVYVRLSIMFQRHVQKEKSLMAKASSANKAIRDTSDEIEAGTETEKALLDLENLKKKQEIKYQKYVKQITKSKKKRFYYIKLFNQTKLLLADAFTGWQADHCDIRKPPASLEEEKARLEKWARSLRSPDGCEQPHDETGVESFGYQRNTSSQFGEDTPDDQLGTNTALADDVQRLNQWAWNLRYRPSVIPEPDIRRVSSSTSTHSINAGGDFSDINLQKSIHPKPNRQLERGGGDFCRAGI